MYLKKVRKQLEEEDIGNLGVKLGELLDSNKTSHSADPNSNKDRPNSGLSPNRTKFEFLDNLPSSSCYRPGPVSNVGNQKDDQTAVRSAEYIGSFSVRGSDQKARVDFVQKQLESMTNSQKKKRVTLLISLTGVKVCSSDGATVFMAHALKRISYATCDPAACQFSFMAREPEGQTDVQFCHAFVTKTPEKAEELNAIISNAFKMAYAKQREKPPTFNELIAQQVTEQQAHFRAIQEQAHQVLQEKLTAIARPTPFSETAIQRMEMRKQQQQQLGESAPSQPGEDPDRDLVVGKNKVWAKHSVDKVKHRVSGTDIDASTTSNQNHSSSASSPLTTTTTSSSPSKSTATPMTALKSALQAAAAKYSPLSSQTSSSSPASSKNNSSSNCVVSSQYHPLSAAAIKESLENSNNSNKFKGSPVTALKDEIDRHFMCNGMGNGVGGVSAVVATPVKGRQSSQSPLRGGVYQRSHVAESCGRSEMELPGPCCNPMANRPLPAVPLLTQDRVLRSPAHQDRVLRSPAHQAAMQNRRSLDDHSLSPSTSGSRRRVSAGSPRRRGQRPVSAIVTSGTIYDNPANGQPYRAGLEEGGGQLYRAGPEEGGAGQYVYGPNVVPRPQAVYRESRSPNRRKSWKAGVENGGEPGEQVVLRYQNASPLQVDRLEELDKAVKSKPGKKRKKFDDQIDGRPRLRLESLMCLDRSHIEDESLRHAPWYQAGIPREIALEILQQEDVGSFIVRDSTTHPGCFALSVRVPKFENANGISHYLVVKTQRGVKLKGLDKEWSNLTALVTHHTVMREMLPCTLRLPRKAKNPTFRSSDKDDREEDPDYQRLSDFSSMMAQLKM